MASAASCLRLCWRRAEFGFVGVELVFDALDVESEEREIFDFGQPGAGGGETCGSVGAGVFAAVVVVAWGFEGEGEDAVFDGGGAVEAPDAVGDLTDQGFFDGAVGLVVGVDGG